MGMTITEKILARASGQPFVLPGDTVETKVDAVWVTEIGGERLTDLFKDFNEIGVNRVWDPSKVIAMVEHSTPPSSPQSAAGAKGVRDFAREQGTIWYEMGRTGIGHQVMVERGHVRPGDVVLAGDSHTAIYGAFGAFSSSIGAMEVNGVLLLGTTWFEVPPQIKFNITGQVPPWVVSKDIILKILGDFGSDIGTDKSVEFAGPVIESMSLDSRLALCNMGAEMGAVNAIIAPDEQSIAYAKQHSNKPFTPLYSDPDAKYEHVFNVDVTGMEPQVAVPYRPANAKPVSEVKGIKFDQAFIGSCCNGRLEDLRMAGQILKNRQVHPDVRLIIIPASQEIYKQCLDEGLIKIFLDANCVVCAPSCGPCGGLDKGLLAAGEVGISSANRNFKGRQGHPDSKSYIANAGTVAASAVAGAIADPREFV
ncbi:MAG: 3-isopropylmalate dehydratase large subunit [Chloroflexi bacterium]|nr:3-isopropylmalate dehydratase large subunit [Chloroflexota bacterium]